MTQLVAIINLTPDSFSDGRKNATAEDYLALIQQAIAEGASVIDLGAESTRPGATLLTPEEEWSRLKPILSIIAPATATASAMSLSTSCTKESGLLAAQATRHSPLAASLSIDTRHPETFRCARAYGATWFNDVSGFQNPESVALARECGCDIVLMHSLTVPANPNITFPEHADVVQEVLGWAEKRIAELKLPKEKIIFDPGIGFGKTPEQSWQLIEQIARFKTLGVRLMVGHSRKSFLQLPMEQRDEATAKITMQLARAGVDYVRIHNVSLNHKAIITT